MSLRYKGGVKSAAGASVATAVGGTGRWTLQEAIQNISAGTWSGLPPPIEYLVVAGGGSGGSSAPGSGGAGRPPQQPGGGAASGGGAAPAQTKAQCKAACNGKEDPDTCKMAC